MDNADGKKRLVRLCALWEYHKISRKDRAMIQALEAMGWHFLRAEEYNCQEQLSIGLICLPDGNNTTEQLNKLAACNPNILWVAVVNHGFFEHPEQRGLLRFLFDYHTRPVNVEWLSHTLGHASGISLLQHACPTKPDAAQLSGNSEMQQILQQAEKVAATDASILLLGPSGTGKQHLSQYIHQHSPRCNQPLVTVNCAGLVPTLIQDELFGHEKGAFTGASQTYIGAFERANGGTLLLDEIGDLPLEQQGNFLHVLERGEIRRVGGHRNIPINVRIISATNVDMEEKIAQGLFRTDLYYRLNIIQLKLPPLSERQEDILPLAHNFVEKFAACYFPPLHFSPEASQALLDYPWPGNIRELANRVMRAVTLCDSSIIEVEHLGLAPSASRHQQSNTLKYALEDTARKMITSALSHHKGNISRAARELGISRYTFYRQLKQLNLDV